MRLYVGEPLDERLWDGEMGQQMGHARGIGHASERSEFLQQDHRRRDNEYYGAHNIR